MASVLNGTGFILITKSVRRVEVKNILIDTMITPKKVEKTSSLYILYKINMFELYVSLTNIYWLVCVMQSHKMWKLDKNLSDLSAE